MSLQRIFIAFSILLFGTIGALALNKKQKSSRETSKIAQKETKKESVQSFQSEPIEIDWKKLQPTNHETAQNLAENEVKNESQSEPEFQQNFLAKQEDLLEDVDNIDLLFQKGSDLPIVETIRYKSRVSWKPGKSAWLIDYASHYSTPIDFIARSLNGVKDYSVKTINDGQEFNILKQNNDFSFHVLIDLSRCKMWLYYLYPEEQETVLLKTYRVGLGRLTDQTKSGSLTPLGTYKLGNRIAIFKPKMMGMHKNKRVELIRVFGTRWIPFEREVANCTEPAKGFGIHGTPWTFDDETERLSENSTSIGKYESDGCIRVKTADMEELFAVISTRPTTVEIVRSFEQAKLPYAVKTPKNAHNLEAHSQETHNNG